MASSDHAMAVRRNGKTKTNDGRDARVENALHPFDLGPARRRGGLVFYLGRRRRDGTPVSLAVGPGALHLTGPSLPPMLARGEGWAAFRRPSGQPLPLRLAAGPLHPGDVVRMGIAVARVLTVLHELEPPVALVDLGSGAVVQTADGRFQVDLMAPPLPSGSPYLAPEVPEDRSTAQPTADLYSLGALLYHALTGELPDPAAGPVPPTDAPWGEAPPRLVDLVTAALDPDPRRRPPAASMLRELRALQVAGVMPVPADDMDDPFPALPGIRTDRSRRATAQADILPAAGAHPEPRAHAGAAAHLPTQGRPARRRQAPRSERRGRVPHSSQGRPRRAGIPPLWVWLAVILAGAGTGVAAAALLASRPLMRVEAGPPSAAPAAPGVGATAEATGAGSNPAGTSAQPQGRTAPGAADGPEPLGPSDDSLPPSGNGSQPAPEESSSRSEVPRQRFATGPEAPSTPTADPATDPAADAGTSPAVVGSPPAGEADPEGGAIPEREPAESDPEPAPGDDSTPTGEVASDPAAGATDEAATGPTADAPVDAADAGGADTPAGAAEAGEADTQADAAGDGEADTPAQTADAAAVAAADTGGDRAADTPAGTANDTVAPLAAAGDAGNENVGDTAETPPAQESPPDPGTVPARIMVQGELLGEARLLWVGHYLYMAVDDFRAMFAVEAELSGERVTLWAGDQTLETEWIQRTPSGRLWLRLDPATVGVAGYTYVGAVESGGVARVYLRPTAP